MMPGRFTLGLGAGEFLNEHIFGDPFPVASVRHEMLEEAVDIMRLLWLGGYQNYHGVHYELQDARLYTLPDEPPPIFLAADGPDAATLAGEIADGLIAVRPDPQLVKCFGAAGGDGPTYGQVTVCWAKSKDEAMTNAQRAWPNAALPSRVGWDIRSPKLFNPLVKVLSREQVAKSIICGPDPEPYAKAIQEYHDAGFDHVYLHQVGHDQEGFFRFYQQELRARYEDRVAV
jgi:G6PDH family F420-dependent oxidoreductase